MKLFIIFYAINSAAERDVLNSFNFRPRRSERKRFFIYCLFAFVIPIILVATVVVTELGEFFPSKFRTRIGVEKCWVQRSQEFVYVYSPIIVLLLLDALFLSRAALKMFQYRREKLIAFAEENSAYLLFHLDKPRLVESFNF